MILGIEPGLGYIVTILSGFVWEIVENTTMVIDMFRENSGPSKDYRGDSKINVVGDVISCQIGFAAAYIFSRNLGGSILPAILYFIISEVYTTTKYRDGMILLAYQLLFNDARLSAWQLEAIPAEYREELEGRAGYLLSNGRPRSIMYETIMNKTRNAIPDKIEEKVIALGTRF